MESMDAFLQQPIRSPVRFGSKGYSPLCPLAVWVGFYAIFVVYYGNLLYLLFANFTERWGAGPL